MAMTVHVDIVSAEAEIYSGLAELVLAPASEGEVGILPRHAPFLSQLKPGTVHLSSVAIMKSLSTCQVAC